MSGNIDDGSPDRRVQRTRRALLDAFNVLVLDRRYEEIRVSDIIERADVGRSTFYEHYLDALRAPLGVLADAIAGQGETGPLVWLMEHFWQNRARARTLLSGPQRPGTTRLTADLIEERLATGGEVRPAQRLAAIHLAEGHLGLLRAWVQGEVTASPAELARVIEESSRRALAVYRGDEPE